MGSIRIKTDDKVDRDLRQGQGKIGKVIRVDRENEQASSSRA